MEDIATLYIKYPSYPNYDANAVIESDPTRVIIQKFEMILFTKPGEIMGYPNFGVDVEKYLWSTRFPADKIKADIQEQMSLYIPELLPSMYDLNIYILPGNTRDIGIVEFTINSLSVTAAFM